MAYQIEHEHFIIDTKSWRGYQVSIWVRPIDREKYVGFSIFPAGVHISGTIGADEARALAELLDAYAQRREPNFATIDLSIEMKRYAKSHHTVILGSPQDDRAATVSRHNPDFISFSIGGDHATINIELTDEAATDFAAALRDATISKA